MCVGGGGVGVDGSLRGVCVCVCVCDVDVNECV